MDASTNKLRIEHVADGEILMIMTLEDLPKRVYPDSVPLQPALKVSTDIAWKYKSSDMRSSSTCSRAWLGYMS